MNIKKNCKILSFMLGVYLLIGLFGLQIFAAEPTTWDPLYKGNNIKISDDKLSINTGGSLSEFVIATKSKNSGKWYWEITVGENFTSTFIGIINDNAKNLEKNSSWRTYATGGELCSGTDNGSISVVSNGLERTRSGNTVGVALDIDNGTLEFFVNGTKLTKGFNDIHNNGTGIYPMLGEGATSRTSDVTANFGATPFKYEIPDGFLPYDTQTENDTNSKLAVLLEVDETAQLSVTSNLEDNKNLMWSSMNEDVATVDKNGKVKAIGEGLTQIYAQNEDGSFKEYINIRVVAKGEAEELRLALNLNVGKSQRLYLNDDYENIEWTSQDKSIATIDKNGKVKAVSEGLVIINATYKDETQMIYVRVTE